MPDTKPSVQNFKCIAGLEFSKEAEKQVVVVKSFYKNEAYLN